MNAKVALFLAVIGVVLLFESEANPLSAVCTQPLETGPCRGAFPYYGYDVVSKQCQYFIYGGCDGNDNRFNTLEDCEAFCKPNKLF